jgi:hypothetical protein
VAGLICLARQDGQNTITTEKLIQSSLSAQINDQPDSKMTELIPKLLRDRAEIGVHYIFCFEDVDDPEVQ